MDSAVDDVKQDSKCCICFDTYTKSKRRKVICVEEDCVHSYCSECLKQHVLTYSHVNPFCPLCQSPIAEENLAEYLGNEFTRTSFKKVVSKALFEEQKSLLPETQLQHQQILRCWNMEELLSHYTDLSIRLLAVAGQLKYGIADDLAALRAAKKSPSRLRPQVATLHLRYEQLQAQYERMQELLPVAEDLSEMYRRTTEYADTSVVAAAEDTARVVLKTEPCGNPTCNGFAVPETLQVQKKSADDGSNNGTKQFKALSCSLCHQVSCKRCATYLGPQSACDEHVCKEDDVATVKEKTKSTKACPNPQCRAPSIKTEGCDQVWCYSCHTVWSWRTNSVLNTRSIHAVDYQRWLRTLSPGRNKDSSTEMVLPQEVGCENLVHRINSATRRYYNLSTVFRLAIEHLLDWHTFGQRMLHFDGGNAHGDDALRENLLKERLKFLASKKADARKKLQDRVHSLNLAHRLQNENAEMLRTISYMIQEILQRFVTDVEGIDSSAEWMENVFTLADLCYENLQRAAEYINSKI